MNGFLTSPIGFYLVFGIVNILSIGATAFIHKGKAKIEDIATQILPQEDVPKVKEVLDVVDQMAETVVQDFNSRIVIGLKQKNLFTPETAASIKQAAIQDVLANLGPLQEKAISLLGPLENIIGQMVEKYVLQSKAQINQLVLAKTSA